MNFRYPSFSLSLSLYLPDDVVLTMKICIKNIYKNQQFLWLIFIFISLKLTMLLKNNYNSFEMRLYVVFKLEQNFTKSFWWAQCINFDRNILSLLNGLQLQCFQKLEFFLWSSTSFSIPYASSYLSLPFPQFVDI